MDSNNPNQIEEIVSNIKSSRKYHNICEDTIRDVIEIMLPRYRKKKDVIKAARRKLHRIKAAYLLRDEISFEEELGVLTKFYSQGNIDEVKKVCLKLMREHASTRERIPILDHFYEEIFTVTGFPKTILDVACGIHPLSIPWMNLLDNSTYWAYEIDSVIVNQLNLFFKAISFEPLAKMQDVICIPPTETGDIAFVMKMVPCLERRQKGISIRLLEVLKVKYLVVSFPIKSLSGYSKNMPMHYTELFYNMVDGCGWKVTKLPIKDELVFVVDKRS